MVTTQARFCLVIPARRKNLRECFNEEDNGSKKITDSVSPITCAPDTAGDNRKPRIVAEAVIDNDQNPVINQAMATLVLDMYGNCYPAN